MASIREIRQQYPQYEDMSDEQLARALHAKHYSDMDFGEFSQRVGLEQPSMGQQIGRQLGLTARHGIEGLAAIPAMVAQPVADIADRGLQAAGSDFRFGNQRERLSNALTRIGLPEPANALERVVGDASQALAAGGGVVGTAQRGTNAIAQTLARAPGYQAAGAVGAGGAVGTTREAGGGPIAQMMAGLAGGFAAPAAVPVGVATARGLAGAVQPATQSGRNAIASRLLQEQATDPRAAAARLEQAAEIVPGSMPTTGAASRDVGLLALEKGLRGRNPAEFGVRGSEQNLARQRALDNIAGDPADITAAVAAREAGTSSARDAAFANVRPLDTRPILARADEILQSPAGARQAVASSVREFRKRIEGESDPRRLYEIRKDIGEAMDGKLAGERGDYRLARRELMQLREAMDESIESVAPGFRAYLDRYREMSKPINQMEALQELQIRSTLAAPDITTGREFLSQAKFTRNLTNMLRDRDIVRNLTPEQIQTARAVAADLDMGAAINSPLIRAPGSDTFQNLSLANVVARARDGKGGTPPMVAGLTRAFNWIYKYADDDINRLLTEAMLDPAIAAQMLRTPTQANADNLSLTLAIKAQQLGLGAGVGTTTTTQ